MGKYKDLNQWIDDNDDGRTDRELANAAIRECSAEALVPAVENYVRMRRRDAVRREERSAIFYALFNEGPGNSCLTGKRKKQILEKVGTELKKLEAFRRVEGFNCVFALGDGRRVTWGEATKEEHLQRVAILERMRAGIEDTIERHKEAVRLLERTGARNLNELFAQEQAG